MGLMFLKGCLCTALEISGSLNAEMNSWCVVRILGTLTKTSANKNWEEREGRKVGKLHEQQHSRSSPSSISTSRMPGHWFVPSGVGWEHHMALTLK